MIKGVGLGCLQDDCLKKVFQKKQFILFQKKQFILFQKKQFILSSFLDRVIPKDPRESTLM